MPTQLPFARHCRSKNMSMQSQAQNRLEWSGRITDALAPKKRQSGAKKDSQEERRREKSATDFFKKRTPLLIPSNRGLFLVFFLLLSFFLSSFFSFFLLFFPTYPTGAGVDCTRASRAGDGNMTHASISAQGFCPTTVTWYLTSRKPFCRVVTPAC